MPTVVLSSAAGTVTTGTIVAVAAAISFFTLKPRQAVRREPFSLSRARDRYATIFHNPLALPLYGLTLLEGICFFAVPPYISAILDAREGVGSFQAGVVIACYGIGGLLFTFVARWLVPRLGSRILVRAGASIAEGSGRWEGLQVRTKGMVSP